MFPTTCRTWNWPLQKRSKANRQAVFTAMLLKNWITMWGAFWMFSLKRDWTKTPTSSLSATMGLGIWATVSPISKSMVGKRKQMTKADLPFHCAATKQRTGKARFVFRLLCGLLTEFRLGKLVQKSRRHWTSCRHSQNLLVEPYPQTE